MLKLFWLGCLCAAGLLFLVALGDYSWQVQRSRI